MKKQVICGLILGSLLLTAASCRIQPPETDRQESQQMSQTEQEEEDSASSVPGSPASRDEGSSAEALPNLSAPEQETGQAPSCPAVSSLPEEPWASDRPDSGAASREPVSQAEKNTSFDALILRHPEQKTPVIWQRLPALPAKIIGVMCGAPSVRC